MGGPVAKVCGWQADHLCIKREVRFGDQSRLVGFLAEPVDGVVRRPGFSRYISTLARTTRSRTQARSPKPAAA